ncbi:sigma-70 family RNA polymerase sigma factor [Salirhabdus sp. Marseille-P4669]|uniref:sigma-70 family RNA polymerase sigma factor n=1 Tax=Salirhabdus sp. Marseille-P4669 TaxID=2042310 RepID=UPI000C7C6F69|nr:sigma-70 family RNA polymerase sigma factor [Salirhabdus sp. Marseille-P4669]
MTKNRKSIILTLPRNKTLGAFQKEAVLVEFKASEFNHVLKEHERLIYHLIHRLGIRDSEGEFYQEGVIALWEAIQTYDEARGKFSSYAYLMVKKALIEVIRKQNRQSKIEEAYKHAVTSSPANFTTSIDISVDPILLNQIKEVLSENQWKWFSMFVLQDRTVKEIASKEMVTENAVKNWGKLAKKKIQKVIDQYNK